MELLWNENEIEVRNIKGKEVRYLNKDASLKFFEAFKEELVAKGLGNLKGRAFAEEDAKKVMAAILKERSKKQEQTPVEEVPVDEVAVEEVPVDGVPVEEVPVEEVPVEEVPVDGVPVEEVPVDGVPVEEVPVDGVPVEYTFDESAVAFINYLSSDFDNYIKSCTGHEDAYDKVFMDVVTLSYFIENMMKYCALSDDENFNIKLIGSAINQVLTHKVNDSTVSNAMMIAKNKILGFDRAGKEAYVSNILFGLSPYHGLIQLEQICKSYPEVEKEYKEIIYLTTVNSVNNFMGEGQIKKAQKFFGAIMDYSPALYNKIVKNMTPFQLITCGITGDLESEKCDTRYSEEYFEMIDEKYKKITPEPVENDSEELEVTKKTQSPFSIFNEDDDSDLEDDDFSDLEEDDFSDLEEDEYFEDEEDEYFEDEEEIIEDEAEESYKITRTGKKLNLSKYALYAVSGLSALATIYYGFVDREEFSAFVASIGTFLVTMVANIKLNNINGGKTNSDDDTNEEEVDEEFDDEEYYSKSL